MNQDQQDKDITEVVHTTSDNATIESITKQDELTLEQMEEVVGGWLGGCGDRNYDPHIKSNPASGGGTLNNRSLLRQPAYKLPA